mgnify:CR=1
MEKNNTPEMCTKQPMQSDSTSAHFQKYKQGMLHFAIDRINQTNI